MPGIRLALGVDAKIDAATGKPYKIGYNQVFIDPASGEELGRREWGAVWPITSESLVSFLYVLHYSLHIPEMWGIDRWGLWLMGSVAMLWTIDCFVGFYLTLPMRRAPDPTVNVPWPASSRAGGGSAGSQPGRSRPAGSAYRINFDIHRASGLWTWGLLFILAFTGVLAEPLSRGLLPADEHRFAGDARTLRCAHAQAAERADRAQARL